MLYKEDIKPIPVITQKQLDAALKKYSHYDSSYTCSGVRQDYRKLNGELWDEFDPYADDTFVSRFSAKGSHLQALWEMHLAEFFIQHLIQPIKKPSEGEPDIILDELYVECVCPQPENVPTLELATTPYDVTAQPVPDNEIKLRITQALTDKHEQYLKRLDKNNIEPTKPYVIALSLSRMGGHILSGLSNSSLVEEALMGYGHWAINTTNESVILNSEKNITNHNDSPVPIGYFQMPEWNEISAVIWTSKAYFEDNDLQIILNPNAKFPLSAQITDLFTDIKKYIKTDNGNTRKKT